MFSSVLAFPQNNATIVRLSPSWHCLTSPPHVRGAKLALH